MQIKVDVPWQTMLLLYAYKDKAEIAAILAVSTKQVDIALEMMRFSTNIYREALLHRYQEGLTYKETAQKMDFKAVSTAKNYIRKGLCLLNKPEYRNRLLLDEKNIAQKIVVAHDEEVVEKKETYTEQTSKLTQWEKDLDQREKALMSWQNGILDRFPTLANVLPVNPALATMKLYELKLSYTTKKVVDGQFENVQELYDYLRNPSAKLRGLNKREMNELRKEVRRASGQTAPETSSENITDYFPDFAEIKPESWSLTPIVIRYDADRKPLEIGLYREAKTGEYVLQIFDGDDVVFCHTVDAALLAPEK